MSQVLKIDFSASFKWLPTGKVAGGSGSTAAFTHQLRYLVTLTKENHETTRTSWNHHDQLLLMQEIPNNHLACIKRVNNGINRDKLQYQLVCRISSFNSTTRKSMSSPCINFCLAGSTRTPWWNWFGLLVPLRWKKTGGFRATKTNSLADVVLIWCSKKQFSYSSSPSSPNAQGDSVTLEGNKPGEQQYVGET